MSMRCGVIWRICLHRRAEGNVCDRLSAFECWKGCAEGGLPRGAVALLSVKA